MPYPYDDESDDSYSYGFTEKQIRAKLDYAIDGDELEDDFELDFGDLDDDEQPDDDDD